MSDMPTDDHMPTWELLVILRCGSHSEDPVDSATMRLAAKEIERLQAEVADLLDVSLPRQRIEAENRRLRNEIDSVVLCRMCYKPDAACQCTHDSPDSWMSLPETLAFADAEIERLRTKLAKYTCLECGKSLCPMAIDRCECNLSNIRVKKSGVGDE